MLTELRGVGGSVGHGCWGAWCWSLGAGRLVRGRRAARGVFEVFVAGSEEGSSFSMDPDEGREFGVGVLDSDILTGAAGDGGVYEEASVVVTEYA